MSIIDYDETRRILEQFVHHQRQQIKFNDELFTIQKQMNKVKTLEKRDQHKERFKMLIKRFRKMYNCRPKPVKVEPKIVFKYVDDQDRTIDMKEIQRKNKLRINNSDSFMGPSSNKMFMSLRFPNSTDQQNSKVNQGFNSSNKTVSIQLKL